MTESTRMVIAGLTEGAGMDVSTDSRSGTQQGHVWLVRLYEAAKCCKLGSLGFDEQRAMVRGLAETIRVHPKVAEDYISTAKGDTRFANQLVLHCQQAAQVLGVSLDNVLQQDSRRDVNPANTDSVARVASSGDAQVDGNPEGGAEMRRKSKARVGASASGCDRCEGSGLVFVEGERGSVLGQPCSCMNVEDARLPNISVQAQKYYGEKRYARIQKKQFTDDPQFEFELAEYEVAKERVRAIEERRSGLAQSLRRIDGALLPNKFLDAVLDDSIPEAVRKWTEKVISGDKSIRRSIVLQGKVGAGKTHTGVAVAKEFLKRTDNSVLYCSSREFFEKARASDRAPFALPKALVEKDDQLEWIKGLLKEVDVLVFDEVGLQRAKDTKLETLIERYEDIIDARYSSGKPTIYITNHTRDQNTSINGKTIDQQIGERAADRLRESVTVDFFGKSCRSGRDLVSAKKDYSDFKSPYPGKDLTSALDIITRLPIFQMVSDQERKLLTKVTESGEIIERDRSDPDVFEGTWEHGSMVVLSGPKCGVDDGIVFLACIQLYSDWSNKGGRGLCFETTLTELCDKLRIQRSGQNRMAIKRALARLMLVRVQFRDGHGRFWGGGMIDSVSFEGAGRGARVVIRFNADMVPFYDAGAYSRIDLAPLMDLNSYGQKMQLFLLSHRDDVKEISIQKWQEIMGQNAVSAKDFRRRVRDSILQQIEHGVLTSESCVRSDGVVVTHLLRSERLTA